MSCPRDPGGPRFPDDEVPSGGDGPMTFVVVDDLKEREPFAGYAGRFLHGDNVSVAFWTVR